MNVWKRRLLAVAIACVLGGCASSGTATPSVSTTAVASVAPTTQPTPTPSPTPSPTQAPLPQGSESITLDPALFAGVVINHPYWPMTPGSKWVYRETDGEGTVQDVEVTVTDQTRMIVGISATVVHDVLSEDGEVVEDTFDWYAQDATGNLWYLGEDTKEFENGKVVSTAGSWETGVNGAQAGIILPAEAAVGMTYRQEFYAGEAEDTAEILSVGEHVVVPFGTFDGALQTKEYTPLEPDVVEHKFYARGVGQVRAVQVSGGTSVEELLSFEPG